MRKLNKLLLFLLPIVVFFTNFPLITLGETDSMHLEISLPEIWLVLFTITSLPNLKNLIKFFTLKKLALVSLFPLYAAASIIWSGNHLRAALTAGLLALIVFAILNVIYLLVVSDPSAKTAAAKKAALVAQGTLRHKLLQVFLITSVVVSVFCWLQCLLDLAGVSRADSLMCAGCTYASFGFPHPNGFTLEPQFMGGLLIAPALLSFYFAFGDTETKHKRAYFILASFFSATLFLTFSRGAIYAFAVALVFLVFSLVFTLKRRTPLLIFPTVIVTSLIVLAAQGIMATLSPTSDNFISGTTKAIHHLTLGHLDLRPTEPEESDAVSRATAGEESDAVSQAAVSQETVSVSSPRQSIYDGYVAESTDTRVNLTNLAIEAAVSDPKILIFGSGLGSAGTTLNEKFPEKIGTPKQIVQNEYASLLLELGLIGYAILIITFIKLFRVSNVLILSVLIGYALTLLFFSGLPNAFHIYLISPLLFGIVSERLTKPTVRRASRK